MVPKPAAAAEVPTNLFHRVAELVSESRVRFQAAVEAGKLPSSCLPPRRRGLGAAVDPTLRAAAPFNDDLFRLVGSLSAKWPIKLSFGEAAKVESLVKGLIDSQSMSFWLLSTFLLWLKELGFVPPDAALFGQLVQNLSLSLVNVVSVSANLAAFFQAKRHEGILSHFPSHVELHFRKDFAGSSFSGTLLFNEEFLARVIAASCFGIWTTG